MKKNYFSLLLLISFGLLSVVEVKAQKHTDKYYNSWRLGLNMGAMWQTADVRSTPGFAGGFTLEKGIAENKTHFFSLAIKGRGLWGNTYGLDYARNYDIKNNPSLNGAYNPTTNYDSLGNAPYIYNNYKTKVAEGALELQICFNQLRERTNILLNFWGGIGFTSYRTKLNLLDSKNQRYNYRLVDSSGSKALALSSHKFLLDGSYESNGTNSQSGNVLTWSPSCGVGLGYRFNDHISLLWEYKLTFPQGTYSDYLDGINKHNNDWLGCNKDYYHYTSLNLLIRLGHGHHKTTTATDVNNYPVYTNTYVANTNTVTNINTNPTTTVITTQSVAVKPIVNITNPPTTPYNESVNRNFPVYADVYNVNQRSQLYVTFNGAQVINYSWNGKTINFTAPLNVGNNIVSVTATNTAGSDSKSAVIVYSGVPPQITITTPGASKVTTGQSTADVYATILNVESAEYISVNYNGVPFSGFGYNTMNKVFNMSVNLVDGTNTVDITATNSFGKDEKAQIIIYKPTTVLTATGTAVKSVSVVITDPTINPYKSSSATYKVRSKITGVNSQSQVTVTANSNPVPFNFVSGNVDFDVPLVTANVLVQVSATNGKSFDSKSTVLTYEAPKKITPPTVVIVNPNPSPYTTTGSVYAFKAKTTYITNPSQLEVKYNGNVISNYSFNASTGFIDYSDNLILNSNNFFEVKATNVYGTANASAIVKQEQPKQKIICHRVDRATMQTMTILESDWAVHQAHGDYEGPCQKVVDPQPDPQITICHQNNDGSKQTISILQSQWPQHQAHGDVMGTCPKIVAEDPIPDPQITICHQTADGSKQTIVILQSQWPSHLAHGDVMGTCPKIVVADPVDLDPDLVICHKNADGTETKMTIKQSQWPAHQAHGDYVGGNCAASTSTAASSSTLEICHNNGDGTKTTMIILISQFPAHRAHGDIMGKCAPQSANTNTVPANNTMTICHKNGDGSTTTMNITPDQWSAHRIHGDVLGVCPPPQKTLNPEGDGGPIKNGGDTDNGNKVPGRTTTTEEPKKIEEPKTTEPEKTQETLKLKPR